MTRTGMLLKKIGMTHLYSSEGKHQPVTVLKNEGCVVLGIKEKEKHGYSSVCIGAGEAKLKRLAKPQRAFYEKTKLDPKQQVMEFRAQGDLPETGKALSTSHFIAGQLVDACCATSIGKGFAGAMKRHHFHGLRATHGVSISHRSHGSTGQCQDPGRVFKGKKMAGHMGAKRITTQNLEVVKVDTDLELVFIKGAVPGPKGSWIALSDAIKRPVPSDAPQPAGFKLDVVEAAPVEAPAAKTAPEAPVEETPAVEASAAEAAPEAPAPAEEKKEEKNEN